MASAVARPVVAHVSRRRRARLSLLPPCRAGAIPRSARRSARSWRPPSPRWSSTSAGSPGAASSRRSRAASPSTPSKHAAKAPPALDRDRHLDLDCCRHSARNPSAAPAAGRCRATKFRADRRDRSDRRHRAPATARASVLAILDRHRAVRPLRHDLHGAAGQPGNPHAHQPVAEAAKHRLGDRGDARRQPCSTIRRGSASRTVSIVSFIRLMVR